MGTRLYIAERDIKLAFYIFFFILMLIVYIKWNEGIH